MKYEIERFDLKNKFKPSVFILQILGFGNYFVRILFILHYRKVKMYTLKSLYVKLKTLNKNVVIYKNKVLYYFYKKNFV